ncbi:MAG: hypothetical protein JSR80_04540 [Verrucomicrobia bacterium]|nr:hypothetical protein [Verrucomicrobiota bacterium]
MKFFDLIGFLVVLLALFAPLLRRLLSKPTRKEEKSEEEHEALTRFFQTLGQPVPQELQQEKPSPVIPKRETKAFKPQLTSQQGQPVRSLETLTDDAYVSVKKQPSQIALLIRRKDSLKEMILLRELFDPPVGWR